MSSSSNSNSNNKKILYQLWTDGRGSFAVRKEKGVQCTGRMKKGMRRFDESSRDEANSCAWARMASWH